MRLKLCAFALTVAVAGGCIAVSMTGPAAAELVPGGWLQRPQAAPDRSRSLSRQLRNRQLRSSHRPLRLRPRHTDRRRARRNRPGRERRPSRHLRLTARSVSDELRRLA